MRLIIVFSWALFFSFLISTIIFVPAFTLAHIKTGNVNEKIKSNSEAIKEQGDILSLPKDVNEKAAVVLSFKNRSLVSEKIESVASGRTSGISLSGLSYKKTEKSDPNQNVVQILATGTAKNRESLLAFEKAIQDMSFVKDVSVPVSSFAKDADLPFTVTITISQN